MTNHAVASMGVKIYWSAAMTKGDLKVPTTIYLPIVRDSSIFTIILDPIYHGLHLS